MQEGITERLKHYVAAHRFLLVVALMLILWNLAFVVFYTYYDFDDNWARGFYFTVQAAYSIGFGVLAERKNETLVVTIVNVLVGSVLIAALVALFADKMTSKKLSWHRELLREAWFDAERDEIEEQRKSARAAAANAARDAHSNPRFSVAATESSCAAELWRCLSCALGCEEVCLRIHRWWALSRGGMINSTLLLVWIAAGVLFAMASKFSQDAVEALYFSITALSTAGLLGIPVDSPNWHYIFVALFCLTGVPIFAAVQGEIAEKLLAEQHRRQTKKLIFQPLTRDEWKAMLLLIRGHHHENQVIRRDQFLAVLLLRSGIIDRETVDGIYEVWDKKNIDKSPTISYPEFLEWFKETRDGEGDSASLLVEDQSALSDGGRGIV